MITFQYNGGNDGYGQQVAFVLEPSRDLITQETRIRHLDSGHTTEKAKSIADFLYHITKGAVWTKLPGQPWDSVGWARLIVTREGSNPLFEGTFMIWSEQFEIRTQHQNSGLSASAGEEELKVYPITTTNSTDIPGPELSLNRAGCITTAGSTLNKRQTWSDESIPGMGSSSNCFDTKRIAYVGVAIDCSYRAAFDSDDDVKRNIINVVNTASVVFEKSFNIALALRDLVISKPECSRNASSTHQWDVPCSNGDLNWRLHRFSAWRATAGDDNAYWTLMTGCAALAGEIGVSWVGEACKSEYDGLGSGIGANVVGHSNTEWQVFAHESAHMFGANHDCDSGACASNLDSSGKCCPLTSSTCNANEEYLMKPIASKGMTGFSPCTVRSICSKIGQAAVDTRCLVSPREMDDLEEEVNLPSSQCGNGIVEAGEMCDCGGNICDEFEARCCDPTTCQWQDEGDCALSQEDDGSGSDFASWVGSHKSLFIGLCAGLGGSFILLVVFVAFASVYHKRRRRRLKEAEFR
ncbi:Metallo-peptidase family M12-domain-containing protein [Aspergillus aurantiobrunneus]